MLLKLCLAIGFSALNICYGADDAYAAAATQSAAGRFHEAGQLFQSALASATSPEEAVRALSGMALADRMLGRLDESERALREAWTKAREHYGPRRAGAAGVQSALGDLIYFRGRKTEGESLLRDALAICEESEPDPLLAHCLNEVGFSLRSAGFLKEAEFALRKSIEIRELPATLRDLAETLDTLRRDGEPEKLYRRALELVGEHAEAGHINAALGEYYLRRGAYADAERTLRSALAIQEKTLGADAPAAAATMRLLADLFTARGRMSAADAYYSRALAIFEKNFGREHLLVATTLEFWARLAALEKRYAEARRRVERALQFREKAFGSSDVSVARSLNNLAYVEVMDQRYGAAEAPARRALAILEKLSAPEHPEKAISLRILAIVNSSRGNYGEAEPLLRRSLEIREAALGPSSRELAPDLSSYASMLRKLRRGSEASLVETRLRAIR